MRALFAIPEGQRQIELIRAIYSDASRLASAPRSRFAPIFLDKMSSLPVGAAGARATLAWEWNLVVTRTGKHSVHATTSARRLGARVLCVLIAGLLSLLAFAPVLLQAARM